MSILKGMMAFMQSTNPKIKEGLNFNQQFLSERACKSKDAKYLKEDEKDIRPIFLRDIDRIVHSQCYSRYLDKAQVYINPLNDHTTHRMQHVQFVSRIARTIGRILKLNEDLIEAIALGHDVGHVAFGHAGERQLNRICERENIGYFCHNAQSVKMLKDIEDVNLSIQTMDGILAHNGEMLLNKYKPNFNKTTEEFLEDLENTYTKKNYSKKIVPMTLEACVVRISDVIAYIGKDIEDAIIEGDIKREELPADVVKILGNKNSSIVETLVDDLVENSIDKDYICFSDEVFNALTKLLDWNYMHIYNVASLNDKMLLEHKFDRLFEVYLEKLNKYDYINEKVNIDDLSYSDKILYSYINSKSKAYLQENNVKRIVIDYISGFTDNFFEREYEIYK